MTGERRKVFVSGCFDMLHSGHVEFFRIASEYGDLYVSIGSDRTVEELKSRQTVFNEDERLFMVRAIRYVTDAFVAQGSGVLDFIKELEELKPEIFLVNEDGDREDKRQLCERLGIKYIVEKRIPPKGIKRRSTTEIRESLGL